MLFQLPEDWSIILEASRLKFTVWELGWRGMAPLPRGLRFDFKHLHGGSQLFWQPLPVSMVIGHTSGTDIHIFRLNTENNEIKIIYTLEATEMAQWLRTCSALAKDMILIYNTHPRWCTAACKLQLQGHWCLWLPWVTTVTWTHKIGLCIDFQVSQGYIVRDCLKVNK